MDEMKRNKCQFNNNYSWIYFQYQLMAATFYIQRRHSLIMIIYLIGKKMKLVMLILISFTLVNDHIM